MNLYDFHTKPESLHRHADADMEVPSIFWDKYKDNPAELKKREDAISKNAEYAYHYAKDILKKPWPKGEDAIFYQVQVNLIKICCAEPAQSRPS